MQVWSAQFISWAKSDPAYNSDSKLFFFSFVAFASGQISYPNTAASSSLQLRFTSSLWCVVRSHRDV
ncbi:hypothetical protein AMECASPLE_038565 [Ameca splendens]|uniref:Uncharacterized protein n=1 Tax=Ameca splendens TaxID=208324 RepID=A0ABV0ZHF2_9TELE